MTESPKMTALRAHLESMCRSIGVNLYVDEKAGCIEVWPRAASEYNSPLMCRMTDCTELDAEVRPKAPRPELTLVPTLTDLKRVSLAPRDTLVLMAEQRYSQEQEALVRHMLKQAFPDNDSLILSGGLRLGVVARESEA